MIKCYVNIQCLVVAEDKEQAVEVATKPFIDKFFTSSISKKPGIVHMEVKGVKEAKVQNRRR